MLLLLWSRCASVGCWPTWCDEEGYAVLLAVDAGGGGGTAATIDFTGTEEATTALTGCCWCWEVTLRRLGGGSSSFAVGSSEGFSASSC